MSNEKYKIEYVAESDKPWIIEFLTRNFYRHEPVTDYLKIIENPPSLQALAKFSTKNLNQNLSFVVKDEDGKVLGVCINSIKTPNDPEGEPVNDPLFGRIAKLLGTVYEDARVFEKFPDVDRVLYVDILSVDKASSGKGLGILLVNETRDLARKQGIKLIRVDCTSHFSARASARLGMECVYELKYVDYKENGVQVFNPDPPHTEVKVYVQRLDR